MNFRRLYRIVIPSDYGKNAGLSTGLGDDKVKMFTIEKMAHNRMQSRTKRP